MLPRFPYEAEMHRTAFGAAWTLTSTVLDGVTGRGPTLDAALHALAVGENVWTERARIEERAIPDPWV